MRRQSKILGIRVKGALPHTFGLADVARHEAGHAVVALCLGYPVVAMFMSRHDGITLIELGLDQRPNGYRVAMYALAGMEAQGAGWIGWQDAVVLLQALQSMGCPEGEVVSVLSVMRASVRRLLAEHEGAVCRIADRLLRAGRLTRPQVHRAALAGSASLRGSLPRRYSRATERTWRLAEAILDWDRAGLTLSDLPKLPDRFAAIEEVLAGLDKASFGIFNLSGDDEPAASCQLRGHEGLDLEPAPTPLSA